ncbi:hypothetical protein EPO17_02630 [Patescibacteria group bacterium]|nr:MAG: hypothetical protein EPO17_02630 [Patescibacteria group bacterium]
MPAKNKTKDEKLAWRKLKWRRDLVGGTIEVFVNCSFNSTLHSFTRGTFRSMRWAWGRPLRFRFTKAQECLSGEGKLRPWEKSKRKDYTYRRQGLHEHRTWAEEVEQMGSLWKRGEVLYFYLPDGVRIALYPVGVTVPKKPFFYQTLAEIKATNAMLGLRVEQIIARFVKGKGRQRSTRK